MHQKQMGTVAAETGQHLAPRTTEEKEEGHGRSVAGKEEDGLAWPLRF